MKRWSFLVFSLVIGLPLLLTLAAPSLEARALPGLPDPPGGSYGAFQADASVFLPLIDNAYIPCKNYATLISPADGSTLTTITPLYKWDGGCEHGATRFKYQLSKDAGFSVVIGTYTDYDAEGPDENLSWVNLDPATRYYWRGWLVFGTTDGPYTDVWSFITGSGGTILPGPILISPPHNTTLPGTDVTLQWNSLPGAVQYTACVGKPGEYSYSCLDETGTQAVPFFIDPNTTYEWWVYARNDYAYGAESVRWQFTTGSATSAAPLQIRQAHLNFTRDANGALSVWEQDGP